MPHDPANTLHRGLPLAQARGALILLHGRGADPYDIAGLGDYLPASALAILAPAASNHTWYPQRFLAPLAENQPWLDSAIAVVDALVNQALAHVPAARIGIAGFSQGGCLAVEYALRHPRRFGLVAGLSASLIGPADTPRPPANLHQTPLLLSCATHDPHIPFPFVTASAQALTAANAAVTIQSFPTTDHTIFPDAIHWLSEQLSNW